MLKKTKIALFAAVSVLIIALALVLDALFLKWVPLLRYPFLSSLFVFLGSSLGLLAYLLFLALLFLYEKKEKFFFYLIIAAILSLGLSLLLKYSVMRPRPEIIPLLIKTTPSFPSTHALVASSTFFFVRKLNLPLQSLAFLFAFLVAFSGYYNGIHYLSDVLVGTFLGIIISYLTLNKLPLIFKRLKHRTKKQKT